MPQPYTHDEQTAIARYFAAGGTVTKLPPCCLQLEGAVPRDEMGSPAKWRYGCGFNARQDGGSGETNIKAEKLGRDEAKAILKQKCDAWNARRSAIAREKYGAVFAMWNDGVDRKEIMRRLTVGKDTIRKAIEWGKAGGQ